MVDIPPPQQPPAIVEQDKSATDIRERINIVRVSFAKARSEAQAKSGVTDPASDPEDPQVVAFNQALPFQNFNQFTNFNQFSNFNDFHNFNQFSNFNNFNNR